MISRSSIRHITGRALPPAPYWQRSSSMTRRGSSRCGRYWDYKLTVTTTIKKRIKNAFEENAIRFPGTDVPGRKRQGRTGIDRRDSQKEKDPPEIPGEYPA